MARSNNAGEFHDPRDEVTHEISEGQVYGDSRMKNGDSYEEKLRIVYQDDERVLLRSNKKLTHGGGAGHLHYRCERPSVFTAHVGAGRYKLLEDSDDAPRMPTDGITAALSKLKMLRDEEKHQVDCGGGRKSEHRLEAFEEAVEAVASLTTESIDWETVDGVGAKTAENLNDAGYETAADIRSVPDEELLDVGGVGQKNLERIKERAGVA